MNRIIAWFAANDVAANLLLGVVLVAGLMTLPTIKQEIFPEAETDLVTVSVPYPGASPSEIEQTINVRIEEKVAGLEGLKRITSTAAEGMGAVTIQAIEGADVRVLLDDVKAQVDSIDTFPEEAEEATVAQVTFRNRVISVAISGNADERTLKRIAEQVRDDLGALPEVSLVTLVGARPYEISVEVSEPVLRRYGLSFSEVADVVRRSSLDLPGGSVRTEGGEILLRAKGQAYAARDFARLVVRARPDGTRLLLGDVAEIRDGFAETDQGVRFDGNTGVLLDVFRVGDQSALTISSAVSAYVESVRPRMPEGIALTTWNDQASILRDRIHTLLVNGLQGLALVFITLAVFLQVRLAFWVAFSIPLALLGAIWMMPTLDVSINLLSLFCFIMVLGIIVDDGTIVAENIYRKKEEGLTGYEAAVQGTSEVSMPVIFGVLTTCAAFLPMLGLPGITGKIMRVFPMTVVPALVFSLIESQLALPAHLKHVLAKSSRFSGPVSRVWERVQEAASNGLAHVVNGYYSPFLNRCLHWRYVTVAAAIGVFVMTGGAIVGGWVSLRWFPDAEADNVVALLTMPRGTTREATQKVLSQLEASATQLRTELESENRSDGPPILHVLASVGEQPFRAAQRVNAGQAAGGESGAHLGEVNIQLAPSAKREFDSMEVARRWRELTGQVPDAVELLYTANLFQSGPAISVQLASSHIDHLGEAAARIKERLAAYPGVYGVADSFRPGKEELVFAIRPAGEALGLTLADLARQVRQGFYGEEAQRVARGREDVKVMVRYPEEGRRTLATLEDMRIRTPSGDEVPLHTVATVTPGRGYALIQRSDRQRIVEVTAEVDPRFGNSNEIVANLKKVVLGSVVDDYQGMSYGFEGEQREQSEAVGGMLRGLGISLILIYALLAMPLGSYIQPFIVMSAIPFGMVGAVVAHGMLGMSMSFLSIFGMVALAGVAVNDSLVLVDYIRRQKLEGVGTLDAVRAAGPARFRAVLLTSLTTFAGLTPILLEQSLQAQFLKPMAVSLGFGVMFSTMVTLVLVPALYLVNDDVLQLVQRLKKTPSPQAALAPE